MSGRIVQIKEEHRGTRGGDYWYVEGDDRKLIHINEIATSKSAQKSKIVHYEVPVRRLEGKRLWSFNFSNSGIVLSHRCDVNAFLHGKDPERPWVPDHDRMKEMGWGYFPGLEIKTKDPKLKRIIRELETHYSTMIKEVKSYAESMGFKINWGNAARTRQIFEDMKRGLFVCLINPCDKARLRSLKVPRRWIYQLWVMKLICDEKGLSVRSFRKENREEKPSWEIEQGSACPAFICENISGPFSFWFEFQPRADAHVFGGITPPRNLRGLDAFGWVADKMHRLKASFPSKRVPLRPDILVCRGKIDHAENIKRVDLVVECKEDDIQFWEKDIENQVIPYRERYKPSNMILVSAKPVPNSIKQKMGGLKVEVVDNLLPENADVIEKFGKSVKNAFSNSAKQ